MIFERRATEFFPDLRRTVTGDACAYRTLVDVRHYERRRVKLIFMRSRNPNAPIVIVDGPTDSPHRYSDYDRQQLCVWYPSDPPDLRWVFEDGLLELLGLVRVHLFKEAWWRDTGEWLGPQAPHSAPDSTPEASS